MQIDVEKSLAQILLADPRLAPIFERLGLDYCCGGKQSLKQACAERGLDPQSVAATLQAMAGAAGGRDDATDWNRATLTELCDHIEATHHRYLVEALPRLGALVDKVSGVHGAAYPRLLEVKQVFSVLRPELLSHLNKEEKVLFPLIRTLEAGNGAMQASVSAPIRQMEAEHDDAGGGLSRLNELTNGYEPPPDACNSYRAMLAGLKELELDMHQHVHKENNILFPKAIQVEEAGAAARR